MSRSRCLLSKIIRLKVLYICILISHVRWYFGIRFFSFLCFDLILRAIYSKFCASFFGIPTDASIAMHDVRFSKNAIYELTKRKNGRPELLAGGWRDSCTHKLDRAINLRPFGETRPDRRTLSDRVEFCLQYDPRLFRRARKIFVWSES